MKSKKRVYDEPFELPGHRMTTAFKDQLFRLVPCGYRPEEFLNLVYVKYKPAAKQNYGSGAKILHVDADSVHFDLPDREVLFTRNGLTVDGDRPFNAPGKKGWDKAVNMTPILSSGDDLPFDRYMINPHAFTPKTEPRTRVAGSVYNPDKVCFADSGAFQLGLGTTNFMHPDDVIGFYERNADEGVTIDIPARALSNEEVLKYTAKVQNLNSRYMKERLPKHFRLATVFHGMDLVTLDQFRRDTEDFDADFPIACFSGTHRYNILEAVHRTLYTISSGAAYPQYHILGVSNPPLLVALIRMVYLLKKSGRRVLLTTDSSSPIAFSYKHTYYSQPAFYNALTPTRYGEKMGSNQDAPAGKVLNVHRRLQTTDPLSEIIGGYQDLVAAYNIKMMRVYVQYVNQIELVRYINQMNHYADVLDHKEYKALVNEQYKGSIHAHLLNVTLDYLQEAFDNGIDKAYNRHKFHMPLFSGESSLHKFPSIGEIEGVAEDDHEVGMKKQRLLKVVKNYLYFHKTGKVPTDVGDTLIHGRGYAKA